MHFFIFLSLLLSLLFNTTHAIEPDPRNPPPPGFISLRAAFPDNEEITLLVKPPMGAPLNVKIRSRNGEVIWNSPPLLPGKYVINYILPPLYDAVAADTVTLKQGDRLQLTPRLISKGSLLVTSNIPEAIFVLRSTTNAQIWKGQGRDFRFRNLASGRYSLSFSSNQPEFFIAPKQVEIYLSVLENKELKVIYQLAGKVIIKSNVNRSTVTIERLEHPRSVVKDEIFEHSKSFVLNEGRYKISLTTTSLDGEAPSVLKLYPPDPIIINVKALHTEELNFAFRLEKAVPIEKQRRLIVSTNIPNGGFSLYAIKKNSKDLIGHYTGKYIEVTLSGGTSYEVVYDEVPNYQTPSPTAVFVAAEETKTIQITYTPLQETVTVPAGRVILGEAHSDDNELPVKVVTISKYFDLGTYEITNSQFANWLNLALKKGLIGYVREADNKGQVVDLQGRLLCKTFAADPYSQISAQLQSLDTPIFMPLPGKDSFPVINVTWYGAIAYCQNNAARLPTEAEWEKAAGMALEIPGEPLKKFIFGFSSDQIDPTFANYKSSDRVIQYFQVLTTPVGFYDGVNALPLSSQNFKQTLTQNAISPSGAYDMSGNVWEWVADWYDEEYYKNMPEIDPQGPSNGSKKVAKGGCYDSLADGVRVSERLGLPPDYCDAYTGFRVVIEQAEGL